MNRHDLTLFGAPFIVAVLIQWFLWWIHIVRFNNSYDLLGTTFVLWFGLFIAYVLGAGSHTD